VADFYKIKVADMYSNTPSTGSDDMDDDVPFWTPRLASRTSSESITLDVIPSVASSNSQATEVVTNLRRIKDLALSRHGRRQVASNRASVDARTI
jgi:hypothetical protein